MFLNTFLPLETALIIVAKLSSAKIMVAASLETSVPVIPMAMPTSAFLSAGASFTPSPVMAVICPLFCHALTILILFSGETLAYTEIFSTFSLSHSSSFLSSIRPVIAISPSRYIPASLAMATAVVLWSPVIMTVFMPALLASITAGIVSSLRGSAMATNPINV